jgi:regulator of cell morphogenesis and NO signaling
MKITQNSIVGEVVKLNYNTATLFVSHHIDYCCGGRVTISQACSKVGVDSDELITQLDTMLAQNDPDAQYINDLNLDELCRYIVKRHHSYVRESIPFLENSLEKLCRVHGEIHPELFELKDLFLTSAGELTKHMQKEEIVLFPYIGKMVLAKEKGTQLLGSPFGSVSNPIGMMMSDHQAEGERFERISEISEHYRIPEDACTTYSVTYQKLNDFETDLHRHIHLENNILFPKAMLLEKEL